LGSWVHPDRLGYLAWLGRHSSRAISPDSVNKNTEHSVKFEFEIKEKTLLKY
jgi:hypothetical protein